MNGDTFQMYLNRLKEDSSESFKSGQSSDKDTFYSSFFRKEGYHEVLFYFHSSPRCFSWCRECGRYAGLQSGELGRGRGSFHILVWYWAYYFFQPLWSETSSEFGMDFWTCIFWLWFPSWRVHFETFDEFRALFKCQGKQKQLLSSWEYVSEYTCCITGLIWNRISI